MTRKWGGSRGSLFPSRSFFVDPDRVRPSHRPTERDVTDIMHATQRVISTSIPSNLIDCENCARSERASELSVQNQQGFPPPKAALSALVGARPAPPEPLRRCVTPFVLHSGNLNRALCIGLTSTSVSRSFVARRGGIGMTTRMKSDQSRWCG